MHCLTHPQTLNPCTPPNLKAPLAPALNAHNKVDPIHRPIPERGPSPSIAPCTIKSPGKAPARTFAAVKARSPYKPLCVPRGLD
jgi:hypothetical protein